MLKTETGNLAYCGGGLFLTEVEWIHPKREEKTYEIIYMVRGTAFMEEGGTEFTLQKGDLKILRPGIVHSGVCKSVTPTSFYWHHFKISGNISEFLPERSLFQSFSGGRIFPEILHLENLCGKQAAEPALLHLLNILKITVPGQTGSERLANRVYEYVRINASAQLTAQKTAAYFGYHPEYLSKVVKQKFGVGLKSVIDKFIINRANELLDNSVYSVKEIAAMLEFREANLFINFYKYHENTTPTKYRSRNFKTHMNAR